jgi:hypothetical protein
MRMNRSLLAMAGAGIAGLALAAWSRGARRNGNGASAAADREVPLAAAHEPLPAPPHEPEAHRTAPPTHGMVPTAEANP